jgi:threonine/homoserine/homoserine lactone efflux protein
MAGLGAAAADTFYGSIAGFSISFVIAFLIREVFWIRLVGGFLLIVIGATYFFHRPVSLREKTDASVHSDMVSAFLLNLTNPTTILSFLAVLAALGMRGHRVWWMTMLVVGGIFVGSMLWWITLALTADHFRDRFNDRAMVWMNRVAGIAIGGFGLVTMILSRLSVK